MTKKYCFDHMSEKIWTQKNVEDKIYIKFTRSRNPRILSQKCVSLMYNDDVDDVRQLRFAICEFQLDWTRMLEHSESRRHSKKNEINFDWFRSQQKWKWRCSHRRGKHLNTRCGHHSPSSTWIPSLSCFVFVVLSNVHRTRGAIYRLDGPH